MQGESQVWFYQFQKILNFITDISNHHHLTFQYAMTFPLIFKQQDIKQQPDTTLPIYLHFKDDTYLHFTEVACHWSQMIEDSYYYQ